MPRHTKGTSGSVPADDGLKKTHHLKLKLNQVELQRIERLAENWRLSRAEAIRDSVKILLAVSTDATNEMLDDAAGLKGMSRPRYVATAVIEALARDYKARKKRTGRKKKRQTSGRSQ